VRNAKNAFELRELGMKHGIFTGVLIDALHHSEVNKDGVIMLSALGAHVQDLVPKFIGNKLLSWGPPGGAQSARFGSRGEDFPLVRRLQ
jgi:hypothetical protein